MNIQVHTTHCCVIHHCKFNSEDCPVVLRQVEQKYVCETCYEQGINNTDTLKQVLAGTTTSCYYCGFITISKPIDMIIFCPTCGTQHIDEPHGEWTNPPHKSHECQNCKITFRIADVPTNGVKYIKTKGKNDTHDYRRTIG